MPNEQSSRPDYDLEEVYDKEISPLMTQIMDICKKHNFPMAMCFQYKSTGEESYEFCDTAILPDERPISEELEKIWNVLTERRKKPLTLKTIGADGKTVRIEEIHS